VAGVVTKNTATKGYRSDLRSVSGTTRLPVTLPGLLLDLCYLFAFGIRNLCCYVHAVYSVHVATRMTLSPSLNSSSPASLPHPLVVQFCIYRDPVPILACLPIVAPVLPTHSR